MRGSDDYAVGETAATAVIPAQDCVRDHRRRGVLIVGREHDRDAIRAQHLQSARAGRPRQRVSVDAQVKRAADVRSPAVVADSLRNGEHVPLVERGIEGRTAVARGSEDDALSRDMRIGLNFVVGGHQTADVDQFGTGRRFSGKGADMGGHGGAFASRWNECRVAAGAYRQFSAQPSHVCTPANVASRRSSISMPSINRLCEDAPRVQA